MFFKNLVIYRLPSGLDTDAAGLSAKLATRPFVTSGATDSESFGWVAPKVGGELVHAIGDHYLIALKQELKTIPAAVIRRHADERASKIEAEEGRKVGRKEKNELKEQVLTDLLPRAFPAEKTTYAWIDTKGGYLIVDASTMNRAETLLELLRKTVQPAPIVQALQLQQSPSAGMNAWIASGEAPADFTIDQDLELRSAEQAKVRYVNHALEGEEIRAYIAAGKIATKLGMTWNDRISFVLTDNLQLRRVALLDIVKEENSGKAEDQDEQFDLDFALMSGEFGQLITAIVEALGGERTDDIDVTVQSAPATDVLAEAA